MWVLSPSALLAVPQRLPRFLPILFSFSRGAAIFRDALVATRSRPKESRRACTGFAFSIILDTFNGQHTTTGARVGFVLKYAILLQSFGNLILAACNYFPKMDRYLEVNPYETVFKGGVFISLQLTFSSAYCWKPGEGRSAEVLTMKDQTY